MVEPRQDVEPFVVRDCAIAAIATGIRVENLRELLQRIETIHEGALFYHFWGGLLRPKFENPEFRNDFAEWARHGLHDHTLAERLAVIDPADYPKLDDLRNEVIEVLEERLEESPTVPWAPRDRQFHFIRSQIVVFDTTRRVDRPDSLPEVLPTLSLGSIFYHFVDARRRTEDGRDDFSAWLAGFGDAYAPLMGRIAEVNRSYAPLPDLRRWLVAMCREYLEEVAS
jgi:hypothetical protein